MAASPLEAVLLGVLEGAAEFLPISSTGHLILASRLFGLEPEAQATFNIVIQLGAILAVLIAYRRRFLDAANGVLRRDPDELRFVRNVALATVPALLVGFLAYDGVKALLGSPETVAVALMAGGVAMLVLERPRRRPVVPSVQAIPAWTALLIGAAQCLALVPGVSRSGATILGALALGVDRRTAAEFTFFLAVPTMTAATGYELMRTWNSLDASQVGIIVIGFSTAFATALLAIRLLVSVVSRFGFAPFAWYRIVIGAAALLWLSQG